MKNEEASNSTVVSKSGKKQPIKPVDADPNGEKLVQVSFFIFYLMFIFCVALNPWTLVVMENVRVNVQIENPLIEGTKYLKLLQKNSSKSIETHLLSFELNMRKQKTLLAFQVGKQVQFLCFVFRI